MLRHSLFVFFLLCFLHLASQNNDSAIERLSHLVRSDSDSAIIVTEALLQGNLKNIQKGIVFRIRGQAFYISGKFEKAGENFIESMKYLNEPNSGIEKGLTLIEQAKLFRKLKMFNDAISTYESAYNIFLSKNDKNNLATVLNEWGVVYEMMGDYNKAIDHYTRSLNLKTELNDSIGIAYSYSFLSNVYFLADDLKTAEKFGYKSFLLFKELKDPIGIAFQSSDFAMIFEKQKKYEAAIKYLQLSDSLAEALNYPDLKAHNYKRIADIYANQNDYKKAFFYRLKYGDLKDSIFSTASQKAIAELNVQYKTAEKDRNILLQKNDLSKQRLYLTVVLALLIITSVLIIFVYRNKRIKERSLKKEAELQAELLKMEAENSLQQDRLRISRDLHDNIGSYLTYLKFNIEEIGMNNEKINSLNEITSETISELRRTVWLINKPEVSVEEWVVKLKDHYRKLDIILVKYHLLDPGQNISAVVATAVFRVVQEAVNNALKHSGADAIIISIKNDDKYLKIEIADNGKGFTINDVNPGNGLGNMKQRLDEINGNLEFTSELNSGTRIKLNISLN